MRALPICFTLSLLLSAPAAWAQGGATTTFTNSSSHTQTFHNTNASVEVDNYLTRITARIGSGPLLFDQTFNVQISDPAVQAAIQQARTQLTNAGGLCLTGINQVGNVKTPTGTMQNTVVNNTQVATDIATSETIPISGPVTIMIADLGLCQGLTGTAPARLPTGCAGGTPFVVPLGVINFNTNVNTQSDIFQTVTTTNTFQIAQTFELDCTAQVPATPAPPSIWLALTGLAAAGAYFLKGKWRNLGTPGGA